MKKLSNSGESEIRNRIPLYERATCINIIGTNYNFLHGMCVNFIEFLCCNAETDELLIIPRGRDQKCLDVFHE